MVKKETVNNMGQFSPTSSHFHRLQVENNNCNSNSWHVVHEVCMKIQLLNDNLGFQRVNAAREIRGLICWVRIIRTSYDIS